MQHDAIIIGGSFAGLSAATQLARARRNVLVLDAGEPRNRFADHSHGFLTQDGSTPQAIREEARRQLAAYPTAAVFETLAVNAVATGEGFEVATNGGRTFATRKLILATGIRDTLPAVPGLAELWGRRVLHCPYCHGYEVAGGVLGVLAAGPTALHQAILVAEWGDVTLFGNGAFEPDNEQVAQMQERKLRFERAPVVAVDERSGEGGLTVVLSDGRSARLDALFTAPRTSMASPLAEQLGCAFGDGMMGPFIKVDERQRTTVPCVYAAGDAARPSHNIALAVADGAWAGICAHQSLVFE
ncbi:NAD(P)/FAD-dependent oxidoreductase [Mesorhizobium sp. BAC0120]|uniref:NAD(P)/FAD-dependent oxidoreductase n=1 Tax=Mesorhizobium sp. BAC0120 TaxID=3090670 RepID=UPI00298C6098|nr:NAD(P)/FAD-dependent oxidoreductase [Mesorhizobium sp. BAC0120]MDW6025241.1 NAD(P)/FAD-dependent oxidoreductase [Mesorhizobium sp. BAC0120]